MVFTHDTEIVLAAAVWLVNSAQEPDALTTTDDVTAFYVENGYTGLHTGDVAELEELRTLRPQLRELLTVDRDAAAEVVNRMLSDGDARPQLRRHDGFDWHLHATEDDQPLAVRIAVETAMAMVDVIRAEETSRLGVCAQDDCEGIVLDLSRNRSRRFCSTTCGNRAAVAAYRARRSG
ncbi:CGNR zinc finger domain-containing protein [Aeromicrobium chenweiae]|uniref:RNA-binding protein n=1 Tax=Aeromicrobium chenweiae TaxID=2079793 RepID=A0A2S0WI79_9ACTN|nr:CGNR zinc finger domain-containing protein [Aeromicrobium chenweiae]AWB91045.1 RNA-binding protein [Aeromicrobium chenweiae]TGN31949.1 CGNR zinc finger domain-containing protein [Aeromicrobium chenweiae]